MLFVVAEFLLSLPLLHITLDEFETLRLFQVDSDRNLLAAYIQFDRFSLAYLLLLLHTQFDVVDFLHILEFLFELNIRDTSMDDGFGFGIELQILLGLFTVDFHSFLETSPLLSLSASCSDRRNTGLRSFSSTARPG